MPRPSYSRRRYKAYLRSPEWAFKRIKKVSMQPYCEACGGTERLECHHLTYDRLYKEVPSDLMVLCHKCHKKAHKVFKRMPKVSTDELRKVLLYFLKK